MPALSPSTLSSSTGITINEVGLRDGLQNLAQFIPTERKLLLLDALLSAGLDHVEAASFVSPLAVPQMADAADLFARLPRKDTVHYSALVPNRKGFARAVAAGATSLASVMAATDAMNRANINMSLQQATKTCLELAGEARANGLRMRAYISVAFICPFEGKVDPGFVRGLAGELLAAGAEDIGIADTIGHANPRDVGRLFGALAREFGAEKISGHFHDTQGLALANCWAAAEQGIRKFNSAIGGLGGCPFAPGAAGNAATEDVVHLFEDAGFDTGVDLDVLEHAVGVAETIIGATLGGAWLRWRRTQSKKANDVSFARAGANR